jgi:hypothetical protein
MEMILLFSHPRFRRAKSVVFCAVLVMAALAGVVVCVLWAQSYQTGYGVVYAWDAQQRDVTVTTDRSRLYLEFFQYADPDEAPKVDLTEIFTFKPPSDTGAGFFRPWNWRGLGFDYHYDPHGAGASTVVYIPLWLPALLLLAPPAVSVLGYLRRQARRKRGLCERCGYDLRASPSQCPECGRRQSSSNRMAPSAPLNVPSSS